MTLVKSRMKLFHAASMSAILSGYCISMQYLNLSQILSTKHFFLITVKHARAHINDSTSPVAGLAGPEPIYCPSAVRSNPAAMKLTNA